MALTHPPHCEATFVSAQKVVKIGESKTTSKLLDSGHWCLKSIKSGFAIAIVASVKNLDVLSQRIDAKK